MTKDKAHEQIQEAICLYIESRTGVDMGENYDLQEEAGLLAHQAMEKTLALIEKVRSGAHPIG